MDSKTITQKRNVMADALRNYTATMARQRLMTPADVRHSIALGVISDPVYTRLQAAIRSADAALYAEGRKELAA